MRWLLVLATAAACHHGSPASKAASPVHNTVAAAPASAEAVTEPACADTAADVTDSVADTATFGSLDPNGIRHVMERQGSEMRRCYERFLKRAVGSGRVIATFTIRPDGSVAKIQMNGFDDALDRCLCNIVARAKFPAVQGTAIVSYPMQFTPS